MLTLPPESNREFKIYDRDVDNNITSKYNFALSLSLAIIPSRSRRTMWPKYPNYKSGNSAFRVKIKNEGFTSVRGPFLESPETLRAIFG